MVYVLFMIEQQLHISGYHFMETKTDNKDATVNNN